MPNRHTGADRQQAAGNRHTGASRHPAAACRKQENLHVCDL